ncbi:DUF1289 domain-containing protein [Methylocystis sp. 9N]|uniref:DUF1289 domain-containing protein n=1 Tax=Methylocystis borbori TaxID=3118750 RepID=A0ABU7XFZ1_9HYPH
MIDSPCIRICELDGEDICVGCGRTRAEIAGWMSMSESRKIQVVELAGERKRARRPANAGAARTDSDAAGAE